MVKPILCYGSELWGYCYRNTVESTHISACKYHLGVGKNTSNQMVLGECGRFPLCLDYHVKFIKYWCKLLHMPQHRFPKQCYIMLKRIDDSGKHTYASDVRNLLFRHGFGFVWISQDIGNIKAFISQFKIRLKDILQQDWHNALSTTSKGRFYTQFKSLLNVEYYLQFDLPFYLRSAFAKFRCSNHNLNIEVGRHHNVPREERLCTFCLEKADIEIVEDEIHVFLHCERYKKYRELYIGKRLTKTNVSFIAYMACSNELELLNICKFVHKIMQIRNGYTVL